MMTPPLIYIALWTLEGGRVMPAVTGVSTFRDWSTDPVQYTLKRVRRFNSRIGKRRMPKAIAFQVVRYAPTSAEFAQPSGRRYA